jgi:hypothetical protein
MKNSVFEQFLSSFYTEIPEIQKKKNDPMNHEFKNF